MKTKTKILAFLEIAIVLCSVFLVAIPAIATEQNQEMQKVSASTITTASKDDYVLGIYGNANEDDTIDMRDLTYVKLIFFGKKPETELADAKYDGKINPLDFIQIKLIIVGKEKELTVVDGADRTVTVDMPIERIAALHSSPCREFIFFGLQDRVVGVPRKYVFDYPDMYPGLTDKLDIGTYSSPNFEMIAKAKPQVMITHTANPTHEKKFELLGIKVLVLYLGGTPKYDYELRLFGFIVGQEEKAKNFLEWEHGITELIKDHTKNLKEEEKVHVFATSFSGVKSGKTDFYTDFAKGKPADLLIKLAGGINIASEFPKSTYVSGEWILKENPEVIILASYYSKEGFGYTVTDKTLAKESLGIVLKHRVLSKTDAVKNGKVHILSYYGLLSGGQSPLGALYLAKRIYPERCEDIDPEEYHREYFERWYNIKCQGVWVYP